MTKTSIEWTDATWNPLRGCSRVSDGCRNCYAERVALRFSGPGQPYEGLVKMTAKGPTWSGQVRTVPDKLSEPLHWKAPRRVFVNSMSDLFHEKVQDSFIFAAFSTMARTPQHTYQILTKRAARMCDLLNQWRELGVTLREGCGAVLPNVWMGVSVEDPAEADARIPLLLDTPAAVRWISAEPLLGPVDLSRWIAVGDPASDMGLSNPGIDWVVAGGESGPKARPSHPDWFRSLRDQCAAAGVPFLFKQWGEHLPADQDECQPGGRPVEWIWSDGQPWDRHDGQRGGVSLLRRVGKKAAGRLLDGALHDAYPKSAERNQHA